MVKNNGLAGKPCTHTNNVIYVHFTGSAFPGASGLHYKDWGSQMEGVVLRDADGAFQETVGGWAKEQLVYTAVIHDPTNAGNYAGGECR